MSLLLPMQPHQFFEAVVLFGMLLVILVFVPVRLAARRRHVLRSRVRLTCRLCGFRFIRRDEVGTCPHCRARNR